MDAMTGFDVPVKDKQEPLVAACPPKREELAGTGARGVQDTQVRVDEWVWLRREAVIVIVQKPSEGCPQRR